MGVKEEKARQSCWCWTKTGRQLAPVKPTRCQKMFDECTAFSRRLTQCETTIKGLKKASDAMLQLSEKTLTQPLPQVWDNSPEGNAIPVPGTGQPLATPGKLQRSKSLDLQQSVYEPINAWQKEYQRMKHRMTELNNQSLRLDAARRAHYKGAQEHLKENVMKSDNVSARGPREEENPELTTARNGYMKIETEVHQELVRLAENARGVQGYLTKAMELQADTLSNAAAVHAQPITPGAPYAASSPGVGASLSAAPPAPTHVHPSQVAPVGGAPIAAR